MAWLSTLKPLARYIPKIKTWPSRDELYRVELDYHRNHPDYFHYGGNFKTQGVRVPEFFFPDTAQVISAHKALPDLINLSGLGVSERVMLSIESLERGIHQFHEVAVRLKGGALASSRYFAMVVMHTAVDQVDLERTIIGPSRIKSLTKIEQPRDGDDGKIFISRAGTSKWHIWYSNDIYSRLTLSDELKSKFDEIGVNCNKYIYMEEL